MSTQLSVTMVTVFAVTTDMAFILLKLRFHFWILMTKITLVYSYSMYNINQIANSKCHTRQKYNIKHKYKRKPCMLTNKQGIPPVTDLNP